MMYFTGFTRFSSNIQIANNVTAEEKHSQLRDMLALVDEAEAVLTDKNRDLDDFGRLLDTTWRITRKTGSRISTGSIDTLYEKAINAGALGGKLLEAGGGGFFVFYVQPEKKANLQKEMEIILHVPFAFENGGTRVIHYTPETYSPV